MDFVIFIFLFIVQRLSELLIAKRNEKWLRQNGAIEYGRRHYPFIIALHTLFILSLIIEYLVRNHPFIDCIFLFFFGVLISMKIWVIFSLGKYWNTKIFRIQGSSPIRRGPYKFLKHPNYIIVVLEFIVIPLVFHLYYTAIIFSILNAFMLSVRVKEEERVWT